MKYILILLLLISGNINAQEPRVLLPSYHSMEVNQVTFSEDGNLFLTSSNDNTIRVWHTKTGACITTYNKHSLKILKAIFIEIKGRDGTFIATASADNTTHIFNAWTGEQIYVYENENNSIVEIAWNKFNNSLIICDTYGEIVEYDLKKGKPKITTKIFNWDGGIISIPHHHQQANGRGLYFYASKGGNVITTFSGKKNWRWLGFKEPIADNERLLKLAYNPKQSVLAIAKTTTEIAFHGLDTNLYKEIKLDDVALNGNRYEKESIKDIRFVDDTKIVVVTNTKFYQIDISDFSIETLFSADNIGSSYIGLSTILFSTELDDHTYRSYLYDVSSNATIDSINHQSKPLNHLMGYNDSLKTYFFMAEEEIFVWKENGDQFKHRIIDFRNRLEKKEIHFDGTFLNQLDLSTGRFFPNRIITKSFWNIVDTIVLNKFKNPNYKEAEYESSNNPKYVYPIQENIMQTFVYEDPNYGTILQAPNEKTTTVIYPMLTLDVRGSMYESKSSERYGTNASADDYVKNRFLEPHYSHNSAIYSENSKFLYATGIDKNIYKYDLTKINKVKVGGKDSDIFYVNRAELSYFEGHQDIPTYLDLSSDGFQLASCGLDNQIIIWDTENNKVEHTLLGHNTNTVLAKFIDNDNRLLSHSTDGISVIWGIKDSINRIATVHDVDHEPFILSGNYFFGSKAISKLIFYELNGEIYPFSQFDLKYNRPDIVLKNLGYASEDLIKSYYQAYKKRLKKTGFSEEQLDEDFHVPEIKIKNKASLARAVHSSDLNLSILATDTRYKIDRINVWANEIPLYGMNGKSFITEHSSSLEEEIQIQLSSGTNKIEVSVHNSKGIESLRETIYIDLDKPAEKSNLYFIGIGTKNYKDSTMNLAYSDKDIRDVAKIFDTNTSFNNIYIDTFLNESVTTSILPQIRKRLEKTTITDHVILMYSGHGILDDSLNYFLSTYDIQFEKPHLKGIPYDAIDHLLDGIPARRKLVLIDACHSGEIDKDELAIESNTNNSVKIETKGDLFKKIKSKGNSFELMKELFTDIRRGTGATVISSSAGKYYSYEDKDSQNGLYTYALKEGLNGEADTNDNGEITVSELKTYLYKRVLELSDGKQKPTARQENLEFDFRVW